MKLKWSKSKKVILSISALGVLNASIVAPILILNKNNQDNNQDNNQKNNQKNNQDPDQIKIMEIVSKIKDKDILINRNAPTNTKNEVQNAIRNSLKIENPTLTNEDLLKISTNISSLKVNQKLEIVINVIINSKIWPLKIYIEKINLLKNISFKWNYREARTIFQDKFKNLWTTGYGLKPHVLKVNLDGDDYANTGWISDNTKGLLKDLKIENGSYAKIFQDKFKNLWILNNKLNVLKPNKDGNGYVKTGWISDNSEDGDPLLKNSNIDYNFAFNHGAIFQDSFDNLWSIGYKSKLQVLKKVSNTKGYVNEGWTNDNTQGLLKGSKIKKGSHATIFQDKFKNLWAMAYESKLQVLKAKPDGTGYVKLGWTDNNNSISGDNLLKNSKIIDGSSKMIFQDSFGNLWAMGKRWLFSWQRPNKKPRESKLQVLKVNQNGTGYVDSGWTNDNDLTSGDNLLKGSNVISGNGGKLFQDKFKNLWLLANNKKLYVLKVNEEGTGYVDSGWTNDNTKGLLKGSKIEDGYYGSIFQDKFKNLWVLGRKRNIINKKRPPSRLQVLKANKDGTGYVNSWVSNNVKNNEILLKGSKITSGSFSVIFQDKFENLWIASEYSRLQVLESNASEDGYINAWQISSWGE